MNFNEAIRRAPEVLALAGAPEPRLGIGQHFVHYAQETAYAAKQIPERRRPEWFRDWALAWRKLYSDFERERERDPMIIYQPRNPTAYEFHCSEALIRYFRAGNRTSKTQSGYAEHYFCVTGYHPYRKMPPVPASTLLVCGMAFTEYVPKTFNKKMLYGEDNNILAPMFPEGGKWFYHYDKQRHTITIACPVCASEGRAGSCPSHHMKTTISLVSCEKGKDVVEGFAVRLAHGDEHIPEEFFNAMKMRIADSPGGGLIFTGTPLHGTEAWEVKQLSRVAEGPFEGNLRTRGDPESGRLVSLHHCSMWAGQVVPTHVVKSLADSFGDEFERRSRIEGIPAPLAANPVFDRKKLEEAEKLCEDGIVGALTCPVPLIEATDETEVIFEPGMGSQLTVWEEPVPGGQYVIGVDTAAGLAQRDFSCAMVLRMRWDGAIRFEQVAEFHGWIPIHEYADEMFKLGVYYNSAPLVVELTGGLGRAVVERLKKELFYWNIFRDVAKGEFADFFTESRFGVDTSAASKPAMVAVLQQLIASERLVLRDRNTITELVGFEQERTDLGYSRYRGAGGSRDDRVMALAIAASAAVSNALYDASGELEEQDKKIAQIIARKEVQDE